MESSLNNEYRTKDLAEAGFLLAKGNQLARTEREGRICWFVFENKEQCQKLVDEFWFGNSLVGAKVFYEAIQTLKNRIFADR